jgi:predicted PurR-regulated permease PerM
MAHQENGDAREPGRPARPPGLAQALIPTGADVRSYAVRVVVTLLITVLIAFGVFLLWRGIDILLEVLAGALFGLFLEALACRVQGRVRIAYGWALALVLAVLFTAVGGLFWLTANRLIAQTEELSRKLPQALKQIEKEIRRADPGDQLAKAVPQSVQDLTSQQGMFERVRGLVTGVANALIGMLVILCVGVFGAAEPDLYKDGLLHLVPLDRRRRVRQALDAVLYNLRWWMVGQFCLMVMVGATTALGLWLMGVPLAFVLGLIAGLLEAVPYLGAWIACIPAALMALLISPGHMFMTGFLFLGIHILEGYIVGPLVQRRSVRLPPALTLVAQILLGEVFGLLGLFVAAPLTVAAVVFIKMLYVEDTLGDRTLDVVGETTCERPPAAEAGRPAG